MPRERSSELRHRFYKQDAAEQQQCLGADGRAAVHDAATAAAQNVPARHKTARSTRRSIKAYAGRLLKHSQLPAYLQDNEYIIGSYRPEQSSIWDSIRTLFRLHNETGNVWTHLLGFLLFLSLACWFLTHPPTPLAVTAEHVEALAADMQHHLSHLHVADNLAALSHSLSDHVHALEHALEGKLSHASHALSDNLHSMQDKLSGNLHVVGSRLSSNLAHLQQGLHSMEAGLHSGASNLAARASNLQSNLGSALRAQLAPIVQWPVPRWPVYVYFAGACVCLLTSGVCHLLGCCQRHIAEMVWRFDYAGIAVLIVASFVPAMYYAFLCEPFWRNFYLLSTASMGCVVVGLSLPTMFQARQYRALRAALFTLLGAWGVVPVTHQLLFYGHVWAIRRAFVLDLGMGLIYLCGAVIYACRIPERWFPGRFDIAGHSHQLWHSAVVAAALVHYNAMMVLLQWRDASGGCAAPSSVNGPLHEVLGAMQQQGQAPLGGIEQVYEHVGLQLQRLSAAAAAGAPLAA